MGESACSSLIAHHFEQFRTRTDKSYSRFSAGAGEVGIFGQESIAGVDCVDALFFGYRNDAVNVEIRSDRAFALADEVRFIRLEAMEAEPVLLCIDGHSTQPEFCGRAKNSYSNFAAVGSE